MPSNVLKKCLSCELHEVAGKAQNSPKSKNSFILKQTRWRKQNKFFIFEIRKKIFLAKIGKVKKNLEIKKI